MKNINQSTHLEKTIGFWTATSIVVGIMIGSGVFVKPAKVLSQTGSTSHALLAWIVGGLMTITAGLTISEVASRIPKTGGIYTYLEEIYGEKIGFLCGWVLTFIYGPGLMGALGLYFSSLLQPFLGYEASLISVVAILSVLFLAVMNILGTKFGGYIQTGTTFIKLIPIFLIIFFGLKNGESTVFSVVSNGYAQIGFGSAVLSTLWAYDGWILVGNMSGEMKDAKKILPKAIIIGLLVVIAAYMGVNAAIFSTFSADKILELGGQTASTVAETVLGTWGGKFVSVGILVSIFGCLNGSILSSPRVPFAMGARGDLKGCDWLSKVHPRFRTPYTAIIMQVGVAISMILLAKPDQITDFAIFSVYIFYTLAFFGLFLLRKKDSNYQGYKTPLYPIVPVIAILSSLYILGSTVVDQTKIAMISIGITLIGYPIYLQLRKKT